MYHRNARSAVGALDGRGLVAVIKRQVPLAGQLDHQLAWGQGWGWVTLPNGVWSGREYFLINLIRKSDFIKTIICHVTRDIVTNPLASHSSKLVQ